jgi:hypothetical protein
MIGKIFESSFLINLFGDTNVAHIFYKSSQTCGMHTNDNKYKGTERVYLCDFNNNSRTEIHLLTKK